MNKKLATKSLSALVFALGASQAAHAHSDVNIQSLEISEESQLSEEEFRTLASAKTASTWGGSSGYISSGNYSSYISSGNYANYISAGNYADYISAGNYASYISAGNYASVSPAESSDFPAPQMAAAEYGEE